MEKVRLTADVVLLASSRRVLLIKRLWDPYKGLGALPGGHVDAGEPTTAAAHRELAEETGLAVDSLDLIGVYADPGRDPCGRYVSFVYSAVIPGVLPVPSAADDAVDARWWPVAELTTQVMAFDHYSIVSDAIPDLGPLRFGDDAVEGFDY